MGSSNLHLVRDPLLGVCFTGDCDFFHHSGTAVLSTSTRGSQMVVGILHQRWNDWDLYLCLLFLLLLQPEWHVGSTAVFFLFWLHGCCVFRLLPHARRSRLSIQFGLCQVHLLPNQERLDQEVGCISGFTLVSPSKVRSCRKRSNEKFAYLYFRQNFETKLCSFRIFNLHTCSATEN